MALFCRNYVDNPGGSQISVEFLNLLFLEFDNAVSKGIQSGVAAHFDIFARMELAAMLADNDLALFNGLIAENFYAQAF